MPADGQHAQNNPPGSKRAAARRRIEEKRVAEAAARAREVRRRRTVISGIAAAVAVIVALVVVFAVQTSRTSTSASAPAPAHTVSHGLVIPVSGPPKAGASPVVVNLYEDLQCPNCRALEQQSGSTLDQLVAQGAVTLHYHPMAFLDSSANQNFATRALNAAAVVANTAGDQAFKKFHDLIYAHQSPESGPGLTDARLIAYAHQAGATGPQVAKDIQDLKYGDWVKQVTEQASKDGVTATPTVIVGGTQLQDLSPSGITAAVQAAAKG